MTANQKPTPMSQRNYDFAIYATLIDGFSDYINSDLIWETYWGWSENPPHTPEEFHEQKFQDFIDRINRVPFDSEPADKGTAFNELVDALVEHRGPSEGFEFEKVVEPDVKEVVTGQVDNCEPDERWADVQYVNNPNAGKVLGIKVRYNFREFYFDIKLVREFANYYKGAVCQLLTEAILPTKYGNVRLYGYIDELMPQSVHDIKTTGRYSVGKFKDHAQHLVYPYCLMENGMDVRDFEYNIAVLDKYGRWETFTEHYAFVPERDIPILTAKVEALIEFLIENKDLITDKKIAPIWAEE